MAIQVTDATVVDADAYFLTRLKNEAWIGSDEATKKAALVTAANILSTLTWMGTPVSIEYAFPRRMVGYAVPVTPTNILWAVYEQAIHLLNNPGILTEEETVESLVLGPVSLQKIEPVRLIPRNVYRLIGPYVSNSGGLSSGNVWWRAN